MKRLTVRAAARCALAAVLLPAHGALAAGARYGLDADLTYDDNASRGLYSADRKADTILAAEGFVARSMPLGERGGLVLRGGARYSQFFLFKDISNLALSGRADYRYQFGRGFGSPWIEVAADLQLLKHADSALRDGGIVALDVSGGSHLTDRVRVAAGLGVAERNGGAEGLYDLSTNRLWASFDYRVGLRNAIYARLARIAGDHVFNSVTVTGLSGVWALDPALADGFGGRAPDAYRLEATTLTYELGFNYPLSGRQALDFSYSGFTSKADSGGYKYDGNQVRVAYLHRFQ